MDDSREEMVRIRKELDASRRELAIQKRSVCKFFVSVVLFSFLHSLDSPSDAYRCQSRFIILHGFTSFGCIRI